MKMPAAYEILSTDGTLVKVLGQVKNKIGLKFSRLTVIAYAGRNHANKVLWRCLCDCGKFSTVIAGSLASGATKSCGCLRDELFTARTNELWRLGLLGKNTKHGNARQGALTTEYTTWHGMKQRVLDPNADNYANYGGRGIKIAERWMEFKNFLEDMGKKPPGKTLDRIDNNGDYCKENCKWSTRKEQANNRRVRRDSRLLLPQRLAL